mmetsp:Transcript_12620/g.19567  ORF Transcript_12620/g.19567 Transcript_12620/m.19567 type:complete len:83 (-) Transcript_12620:330-578(-)
MSLGCKDGEEDGGDNCDESGVEGEVVLIAGAIDGVVEESIEGEDEGRAVGLVEYTSEGLIEGILVGRMESTLDGITEGEIVG